MDFKESMKCLVNVNLSGPLVPGRAGLTQRNSPTCEAQVNGSAPDGSCTDGSETGSKPLVLVCEVSIATQDGEFNQFDQGPIDLKSGELPQVFCFHSVHVTRMKEFVPAMLNRACSPEEHCLFTV